MSIRIRAPRKPFRAWLWAQYMENKDEYQEVGQTQPHSFEVYVKDNIKELMAKYRLTTRS